MDPVTDSVIASIPVLLAIISAILRGSAKSGDAPANAQEAAADVQDAADAATAGGDPGTVDQAVAMAQQADAGGGGPAGADSAMVPEGAVRLPGGIVAQKSHLMLGGAVVLGLVVLSMVGKKKA
jgi:hypothetical protein